MKAMRPRPISVLTLLLALIIAMPIVTGCEMVASYLIYDWLDNEFGDDDPPEEPIITRISADRETIYTGDQVTLEAEADDDEDSQAEMDYFWFASEGSMASPTNRITIWTAPDEPGTVTISVMVTDSDDNQDSASVEIVVLDSAILGGSG